MKASRIQPLTLLLLYPSPPPFFVCPTVCYLVTPSLSTPHATPCDLHPRGSHPESEPEEKGGVNALRGPWHDGRVTVLIGNTIIEEAVSQPPHPLPNLPGHRKLPEHVHTPGCADSTFRSRSMYRSTLCSFPRKFLGIIDRLSFTAKSFR